MSESELQNRPLFKFFVVIYIFARMTVDFAELWLQRLSKLETTTPKNTNPNFNTNLRLIVTLALNSNHNPKSD